jgi:hypothetical protein
MNVAKLGSTYNTTCFLQQPKINTFLNELHMKKYNMYSLTAKGKIVNVCKIYEPQVQSLTNLGLSSEYGDICTFDILLILLYTALK